MKTNINRRDFIKKEIRTLSFLGLLFTGVVNLTSCSPDDIPDDDQEGPSGCSDCNNTCSGTAKSGGCTGCGNSCSGNCDNTCKNTAKSSGCSGCGSTCTNGCQNTCKTSCRGGCDTSCLAGCKTSCKGGCDGTAKCAYMHCYSAL